MLKIAHRGYSHKYIDNSIDAFIGAIEEGFDMIETDIQLCKNNDIVVFHDNMINNKEIIDMTLLELEELGIISLKTFFNLIDTLYIEVYLDLKGTSQLANMLVDFECDFAQGYFWSKALPKREFVTFVEEFNAANNT